ncbi:MAG: PBSX family phage terminase large subunit [Elusimicrobiaceae bacterium]
MKRFEVTSVFERTHDATERVVINIGGARSSKSFSVIQLLIMLANNAPCKIGVLRKTMPALRRTSYRAFIDALKTYGLYSSENHNKSSDILRLGGSTIDFMGLDEPQKVKSADFNFIWMEEANEFTFEDFTILGTRLSTPPVPGRRNQMFLSLNPSEANGWIPKKLMIQPDVRVIRSSYLDNPFLPQDYINFLEGLKETDPVSYQIYALGEWGKTGARIYNRFDFVDTLPEHPDETIYGLDFGYNNPSVLIRVDIKDGELYLSEGFYETRLTNADLIVKLTEIIQAEARRRPIYADAAEPARIADIEQSGFNIHSADKSVSDGIDAVRTYPLHILKSSELLTEEIQEYKYKVSRSGDILDEPAKIKDHAMDALRYAVYTHFKNPHVSGRNILMDVNNDMNILVKIHG